MPVRAMGRCHCQIITALWQRLRDACPSREAPLDVPVFKRVVQREVWNWTTLREVEKACRHEKECLAQVRCVLQAAHTLDTAAGTTTRVAV